MWILDFIGIGLVIVTISAYCYSLWDETGLFFMPRDLKKTTKKVIIIELDNCRMVSKYIGDTFMLSNIYQHIIIEK